MISGCIAGSADCNRTHPEPSGSSKAQAMRAVPDGTISPVITFQIARVCSITSQGYDGGSEVTRSPNRSASALAVSRTSSRTRNDTEPIGWLNKFRPTPGKLAKTGIPNRSNCSRGPTPDNIKMCGDFNAPAHNTTRSVSSVKISPPLSASTPQTRNPPSS